MANFFTRALDVVTPWNRGGELVRRKKREEEQQQQQRQARSAPQVRNTQPQQQSFGQEPTPQRPVNIFEDLNQNLTLGQNKPNFVVPVTQNQDSKPVQQPQPGTLVKPKQSLFDELRDVVDANTKADQYRRAEGNRTKGENKPIILKNPGNIITKTPIVGTAVKDVNTFAAQAPQVALTAQERLATAEQGAASEEYSKAVKSGDKNRIQAAKVKAVNAAARIRNIKDKINANDENFAKNKGGLFNVGTLYDKEAAQRGDFNTARNEIAIPGAVAALDAYTLGQGNVISEGLKQGGVGLTKVLPNIAKAAAGNYGSGDLAVRGEGGTNEQAVKAGLLNSILGLIPDVGLPLAYKGFTNKVLPKLFSGKNVAAKDVVSELDDAAISASAESAIQATRPRPIPVAKNIPVTEALGDNLDIPVSVAEKPRGPIIREIGGDTAKVTPDATIADNVVQVRRAEAQAVNNNAIPDRRVDGAKAGPSEAPFNLDNNNVVKTQDDLIDQYASTLRDVGEGNGVTITPDGRRVSSNYRTGETAGKRMTKADWRDEAERQLRSGKGDPSIQGAFDDAVNPEVQSLLAKGEQPDVPQGRPIAVKQANGISVIDNTDVPQNLPETPGTVRVTDATAPNNAKSEVVAQQLPPIPKVGSTTPDGKVVTKRMVESARNQRKNAKALAKAQDEAALAMEKVNAANNPNAALDSRQPGLILSDEVKKGKKGQYQVARQADQTNELGTKSVGQVIEEADASVKASGSLTDRDIANVKAALDSGTYNPRSPEYKKLSDLYWKDGGTHDAQRLALRNQNLHRTGTSREISNRAVSKIYALAEDPGKITDKQIANIQKTADDFTNLRDTRAKATDDFNANPTKENHDRFINLDKQLVKAEKDMAMSQYSAAKSALKGNTNVKLRRLIEDAAEDADLYTMDFVDSALLSGTGTFVRNFVNASLGSAEEGAFGGVGSRIGRAIQGAPVGGGVGRGSISGFKKGAANIVDATKTRFKDAGWNPIAHMKNWSTTGNQLGDSMIEGSIGRSVRNHYQQILKKQGYSGEELRLRADVMARTDPEKLAENTYGPQARTDAGLGSGISKRSSFEKGAQREIADGIAKMMGKEYSQGGESVAKALTRLTLGFPSAVGRSLVAGSQRIVPFANIDTVKAFTAPDATLRAAAIKESIKKSGSAATAATVFGLMGANDMVTGAYPKDPEERAKWEREGIKENSIKIGDAWYDAPSYLGSFGLPVLAWASIGRNGGVNKESLNDIKAIVGSMSPTENLTDINDVLDGKTDLSKYTQRLAASAGRMVTPYGSLLNQVSKIFDTTQNDTSGDTWAEGVFNKLLDGVPFLDKSLPDKTDKEGNPLYNPSVVETMAGAAGAVQGKGEELSKQIDEKTNSTLSKIDQYGLLDDPNLDGVLEGTAKEALVKSKSGKQLDESDIKALKEGLVKGVSQEGTDTAYLEREQYDTNLAVLKMKRDLMQEDKTVKPSSLKDIDTAIKRGEIYKSSKMPYDMISEYQSTGVEEWRKMGDPEDEEYNPEMYQKLFEIDDKMTKAGVSYKKGALDKPKYTAKTSKGRGGGGGSGARQLDTSFGTLKSGSGTPKVREYDSIDGKAGNVPIIRRTRPNIVHKISSS